MPLSIRPLSPELQEIAISQLNEDPKRIEADILAIKEWLKKQPHLTCRQDDQYLLIYLRGCKFSLERVKEKIDNYLTFKTLLPEFFHDRDLSKPVLKEVLDLGIMLILDKPDQHGRALGLVRFGQLNPKKYDILDVMKVNTIISEIIMLENDRAVVAGMVSVIDCQGITLDHMMAMTPSLMKKAVKITEDGFPLRPKAIHYINAPSAMESFFNLFKSFMKKKLADRLHIHGSDLTEFYKLVPRAALPREYGGDAGPINALTASFNAKIMSYKDYMVEDEKYKSDEKKRIGSPKTSSDMFGMEGSFRTLSLD